MSVVDDRLLTTTLPFPTRCATCRRWYAAFKAKFARWNKTVFSNKVLSSSDTPAPDHIEIPPDLLELILGFPHTMNVAQCRTKPPPALRQLLAGLDVTVEALETHGGLGRIYTLRDTTKILKVADIRTSWCKYEPANYALLKSRGIPCAHLAFSTTRTVHVPGVAVDAAYVVMAMERLDFTMTACIRAMARAAPNPARSPAHIAAILQRFLDTLAAQGLVYGDLSPDNIMFRFVGGTRYELALIDPQFVVPLEAFKVAMGPARAMAFDTTYLALKVQAIGLLDPEISKFTDAACAHILGHTPLERHTRRWLLHEAPVGLFMAYDILREANRKSSRLK
jgi:hypothetical protein